MQAFVRAVFLWGCGVNALMLNPEPHPPDIEGRQAARTKRDKRRPGVGAHRTGQPILATRPLAHGPCEGAMHRGEAVTCEEEAAVQTRYGEGKAGHAILRAELACEVGGPEIVRFGGARIDDAKMRRGASPPSGRHQACALEQRARRARGRPVVHERVPRTEPVQHELWPPIRMRTPGREDQRGDALIGLRRTRMRCPTSILHPGAPFLGNPRHPFVARLPTDRVARTELVHRVHATPVLGKKLFPLVQWRRLRSWHRNLRLLATGVSVSAMYPVSSVTYVPGLYPV